MFYIIRSFCILSFIANIRFYINTIAKQRSDSGIFSVSVPDHSRNKTRGKKLSYSTTKFIFKYCMSSIRVIYLHKNMYVNSTITYLIPDPSCFDCSATEVVGDHYKSININ